MRCPFCQNVELKVTDSRNAIETNAVRRRRECLKCNRRFTTFETIELLMQVQKRDGRYEDYDQEKLIRGLDAACLHTHVSRDQVRMIAYRITSDLLEKGVKEIQTSVIGEMAMQSLQKRDPIAYIRFACVHRPFKDVDELKEAIQCINIHEETRGEYAIEEN